MSSSKYQHNNEKRKSPSELLLWSPQNSQITLLPRTGDLTVLGTMTIHYKTAGGGHDCSLSQKNVLYDIHFKFCLVTSASSLLTQYKFLTTAVLKGRMEGSHHTTQPLYSRLSCIQYGFRYKVTFRSKARRPISCSSGMYFLLIFMIKQAFRENNLVAIYPCD